MYFLATMFRTTKAGTLKIFTRFRNSIYSQSCLQASTQPNRISLFGSKDYF